MPTAPAPAFRGRPPRSETPNSRKRRAAAAAAAASSGQDDSSCRTGHDSEQSSKLLRPAHSFTGGGGLGGLFGVGFGGMGGGGAGVGVGAFDDDDLDNFAQYVQDDDDDDDDDDDQSSTEFLEEGTEVGYHTAAGRRRQEASADAPAYKEGGVRRFFSFGLGKKRTRSSNNNNKSSNNRSRSDSAASSSIEFQQQQQQQQPASFQHVSQSSPPHYHHQQQQQPSLSLRRPRSTQSHHQHNQHQHNQQPPPFLSMASGSPTEIHCNHNNQHNSKSAQERSRSVPDYRTYNPTPQSTTLPRMGSFDLEIDTIPAFAQDSTRSFTENNTANDEPVESIDGVEVQHDDDDDEGMVRKTTSVYLKEESSAMVPFTRTTTTGSVEVIDPHSNGSVFLDRHGHPVGILPHGGDTTSHDSSRRNTTTTTTTSSRTGMPMMRRQASWDRRLGRSDIYQKQYVPSRSELEELQELEDYLGIFSTTTKHRFAALWRQLVPPLDIIARQRATAALTTHHRRQHSLQSQGSSSSLSTLSTNTNFPPKNSTALGSPNNANNNINKALFYSIVLKRGPIQFEQYQDFSSELILLTRGFVVARPNYQFIPRFQAGDLWTSVVQVQPTNPLSITLSCTSRTTSSHLTLTQLKQQQQYGCYTYEISCETPQEQASWLEALRKVVIQAHDTAATNEKEVGGLGWQYRVVYVPFYTEAVTGNPIQKEKILAGSSGHVDLNALDTYNSYAPLHYATRANHVRVMRFLLEAGADVEVGDGYGRTPMYYAELHQLPEASIQMLENYGAKRSKKYPTKGLAGKAFAAPRTCQKKLAIVACVLLLVACGASALLWKFGMLKALGIGGNSEAQDATSLSSEATFAVATSQPSPPVLEVIPPITSRGNSSGADDSPTMAPSVYKKTPFPTPVATVNPTTAPTSAAYTTDLFLLLEASSFDAGAALRQDNSPQQRAMMWLLQNVNLDSYTNNKKIQRYALAVFYYSTNGDGWGENLWWMSDEDECMWYNKQVASGYPSCEISTSYDKSRTFSSLDLSFNNVRGTIPPELGLLSGLRRVDLDGGPSGFLTGTIPSDLGHLNLIESFSALGNQLTGTLPLELGNWGLVRGIDLSWNKLAGSLPPSLGSMIWLTELNLEMNDFSGPLPGANLGRLSNLFKLALGGCNLTGPIPSEIGLLTKLRYLYLEMNQFTFLPSNIGSLVNLNVLSLNDNDIQGVLPSEIGGLTKLGSLLLRSNSFASAIPSEVGMMVALQTTLDLSSNLFHGPIPSEMGNLTLLRSLYLQSNKLNGAMPNELAQLSQLNSVRIESNGIVGTVPMDLCDIFATTFPNFYADCDAEVSCSCCTYCCTDGGNCSCQYAGTDYAFLC